MNRCCPVCELRFEREPGYFLGAMYFSYALALLAVLPVAGVLFYLRISSPVIAVVAAVQLALMSPLLVCYSRVIWLHFEQTFDPPGDEDGA